MTSSDAVLAKIAELKAERERNVIRSSLAHGKEITSVPPLAVTIIEECRYLKFINLQFHCDSCF